MTLDRAALSPSNPANHRLAGLTLLAFVVGAALVVVGGPSIADAGPAVQTAAVFALLVIPFAVDHLGPTPDYDRVYFTRYSSEGNSIQLQQWLVLSLGVAAALVVLAAPALYLLDVAVVVWGLTAAHACLAAGFFAGYVVGPPEENPPLSTLGSGH